MIITRDTKFSEFYKESQQVWWRKRGHEENLCKGSSRGTTGWWDVNLQRLQHEQRTKKSQINAYSHF